MDSKSNWFQLGTKHFLYQALVTFLQKKGIEVNKFGSVILGIQMCMLQTRAEYKKGDHRIEL